MSKSPAIGIDFGTANSCVAVFHQGKVEVIPNDYGNRTTPSIVGFSKNGRFVGEMARTQQMSNLENTIFDVKRLIGREFFSKTVQDDIRWFPFKVDHLFEMTKIKAQFKGKKKHFCPEEICAMILSKMKSTASEHLGVPVRNAVITVPAYFNDSQRQSIKDCGSIAGLNVLRIMNESSAAAIAYGFNNPKPFGERYLLVFDLGAGNFNISVIGVRGGLFDVRSVSGHTHLGGENFTRKLVNYCIGQFRDTYGRDIIDDKRAIQRLRNACEEAKRSLTSATSAQIDLPALYSKIDFKITITRDKFEELCLELFKSLIPPFVRALADSKLSQSQIDEVILVGGSSRIPKIQQLLSDFFASKRLIVNTDEAVAIGAAIQAAILNGDQSNLLRERIKLFDVAPLSLGVELKDNRMGIVIPANTNIPTKRIKTFSVVTEEEEIGKVNKSRSMLLLIKVFEGEGEFARDNHSLGHFLFQGSSSLANSNEPEFDVSFDIDENGILDVYALETGTDNRAELTVTGNKSRLPRKQIEEMKRDVELFQVEDVQHRQLVNARNELETYISKIRSNVGSSTSNSNKIVIKLNKVMSWLDKNPNADKKDLNEKKTKIEKLVFASKLSIKN